ncbi:sugar transferase [Streptomyces albireticuli]|uniref:Bacterial sugar transferase domain-containing protein n=1 Tax=Streptomyces albireticuli TaxID=1940 RepID=A0A2A2DGB8_9ACTN|nr:sugar transferase [Streptomyces albireticuli]MCD9145217.1 sugar transferase [Streptomyces albireticuli]MCD9164608.1 sugar transferase [Streptomyces albireticuli]MCD9194873.1 sugar transferase [Streptomyces albireticuli]PAU50516.1 hypothetical protein CK936_02370 [Streptomyces albireticuli]
MSAHGDEGIVETINDLMTAINGHALVCSPDNAAADRRLREFKDAFDAGLATEIPEESVERKLIEIKIEAARRAVVRGHPAGSAGLQEFLSLAALSGGRAADPDSDDPGAAAVRGGRRRRRWWCRFGMGFLLVVALALALVSLPDNGVPRWVQTLLQSVGFGVIVSTALFTAIHLRDLREHRPGGLQPDALARLRPQAVEVADPPAPMSRSRRALDVVVGAALLWISLPMLASVSLWIRLTSHGPALVRHPRVGAAGRVFQLYDFRTRDAAGRQTKVGEFLEELGLETLPRLWNLFRGDVTLLGPPAEHPAMAASYPGQCRWVFSYRPGIAGPLWDGYVGPDDDLEPGSDAWRHYLDVVVPQRVMVDRGFYDSLSAWGTFRLICGMLFSSNSFTAYSAGDQEEAASGTAAAVAEPAAATPQPLREPLEKRCLVSLTVWQ